MSLQVWLPLNGSLKNLGLDGSATITGTPAWGTNGKIGNNYLSTSNALTLTTNALKNTQIMSVSFWINLSDTAITAPWTRICQFSDGSSNLRIESCPSTATNWRFLSVHNNDGYLMGGDGLISSDKNLLNKWTHVVYTYDNVYTHKAKAYINGVKTFDVTISGKTGKFTGSVTIENSNKYKINDYRIYSHALTKTEVQELSKGLVAHYRLTGNSTQNLLNNTSNFSANTSWYSVNSSVVNHTVKDNVKVLTGTKGTTDSMLGQTINFNYTKNTKIKFVFKTLIYSDVDNNSLDVQFYINNSGWKKLSKTVNNFYIDGVKTSTISKKGWHNLIVFLEVYHTTLDATQLIFCLSCSGTTAYYTNLFLNQVDFLPHYYIPKSTENMFTTMGYNSLVEEDCSGYGNKGTKSKVFPIDINSPMNESCYVFDNTNTSYIACGRGPMVTDEITISLWAYMSDWTKFTNNRLISCTESGGWTLESNASGINFALASTSNTYTTNTIIPYAKLTAGWHLITVTYDGLCKKAYVDGVLVTTTNLYTSKTAIKYHSSNGIFIGAESAGSQTTPTSPYFNGNISDVRIYATALTQDQITELYNLHNNKLKAYYYGDMTVTPAQNGWAGSYAYDSTTQIATLTSTNGWHTFCWNVSSIPEGQEFIVEFDYYFTDLSNKSSTGVFTRMADDPAYSTPIDQLDITATTTFVHYKGTYTGGKKYFGINVRGNDSTGLSIVMKMKNLEIYYIK